LVPRYADSRHWQHRTALAEWNAQVLQQWHNNGTTMPRWIYETRSSEEVVARNIKWQLRARAFTAHNNSMQSKWLGAGWMQ
jgi:hypothetical protein